MFLLPVIDLLSGRAVHARAGDRSRYQPLTSIWTPHADNPLALTDALRAQLGVSTFYLADLNALDQSGNNHQIILSLLDAGHQLWLDAGVQTLDEAQRWIATGVNRLILSSESLPSLQFLQEAAARLDRNRLVFSLDLYFGCLRSRLHVFDNFLGAQDNHLNTDVLLRITDWITAQGIRQMIILDTAMVGAQSGPTLLPLIRIVHERFPQLALITGGGIRSRDDLQQLITAGVHITLIATALHSGQLLPGDLIDYPFLACSPPSGFKIFEKHEK